MLKIGMIVGSTRPNRFALAIRTNRASAKTNRKTGGTIPPVLPTKRRPTEISVHPPQC